MLGGLGQKIIAFWNNRRGNVAITFVWSMIPVMVILGGGADLILLQHMTRKTRIAAETAVFTAISPKIIDADKIPADILTDVDAEVKKEFELQMSHQGLTNFVLSAAYKPASYTKDERIITQMCYKGEVKTNFAGILSYDRFFYEDCVEAISAKMLKYYDIYFVVDSSTSMGFGATKQDQKNIKDNQELQKIAFTLSADTGRGVDSYQYDVLGTKNTRLRSDCAHICHLHYTENDTMPEVAKKYESTIKTRLDVAKANMVNFINSIDNSYFTNSRIRVNIIRFSSAGFKYDPARVKKYVQEPSVTTFRITSMNPNRTDIIKKIAEIDLDITLKPNTNQEFQNEFVEGGGGTNFYSSFKYIYDKNLIEYVDPKNRTGARGKPLQYIFLVTDGVDNTKNSIIAGFNNPKYGHSIHINSQPNSTPEPDDKTYYTYYVMWSERRPNEQNLPLIYDQGSYTHRMNTMHKDLCRDIASLGEFYIMRMPVFLEDTQSHLSSDYKSHLLGGIDDSETADTALTRGIKACANAPAGEERVIYADSEKRLAGIKERIFPNRLQSVTVK